MAQDTPDKVIDIPNVGQVAFPGSMSDADINTAAAKLYQEKNPSHPAPDPKHSWIDTAVDWLPTAGGIVGGLAGSAGGPVGAMVGATAGGAAGQGLKQKINEARGAVPPATGMNAIRQIGEMGKQGAIQGGAELIGQGIAAGGVKLAQHLGERAMTSAIGAAPGIKVASKAAVKGETLPVVKTLLNEGINVSPRGVEKLNVLINATNEEIKAALEPVAHLPVNPYKVTAKLGETAKTFAQQATPETDLRMVSNAGQEFLRSHPDLTVGSAQAIKQGTYKQLAGKYGELKGAEIESQKALARGLKDAIADEVDQSLAGLKGKLGMEGGVDITKANAREGALMQARDAVAKKVALAQRRDPMGLASLAVSHPMTFLTVLMDRNPTVKSLIARGLYGPASSVAGVSPVLLKAAIAAVASGDDSAPTAAEAGQP